MPGLGRRLRRLSKLLFTAIGVIALTSALGFDLIMLAISWKESPATDREGWWADYAQLRGAIEQSYPNLQWTIDKGELDLAELDRATQERIEAARTTAEANRAMRDFVRAFGDGHLALIPAKRPRWELEKLKVDTLDRNTPARNACATLGYRYRRVSGPPFDFEGIERFTPFDDANAFDAGVLTLDGHRIGIVRVASFDDQSYIPTCRNEWNRRRVTLDTTCEEGCRREFEIAVRERLILEFESRIRQFQSAGVELVALDLTGNSGGYPWHEPIVRSLTGKDLPWPPTAFVRNPETVDELDGQMRHLDRVLALCPMPRGARQRVIATYRRLDAARTEALAPCKREMVWSEEGANPVCSQLTSAMDFGSDAMAGLDLHTERRVSLDETIFARWRYRQPRVTWGGRTVVLIDEDTASMAEIVAGSLKDYAGLTIIGERTSGCGSGWHRGYSPLVLRYSQLELHVPDSVAYRIDGSNYRDGIEPDIATGWKPEQRKEVKARRLITALRQIFSEPTRASGFISSPM